MNKRVLVLCTILALLLLSGIGYGFYRLFSASNLRVMVSDSQVSTIHAVPSDAIIIYDLNRFSNFSSSLLSESSNFSSLIGKDSPLLSFLKLMPESAENYNAVLSLHYSSRDEVSPLFILELPKSLDKNEFAGAILKKCSGVILKKYDGNTLYSSVVPKIAYSVCGNFLIASPSLVILESSIRHLQSGSSILQNPIFREMISVAKGGASVHVNHQNLGKLFSGIVNQPYLRYADFFRTFSAWTTINLNSKDESCLGRGEVYNKNEHYFSTIFNFQESLESDIHNHLPFNTNYFLSIPLHDNNAYVSKYRAYLDAQKALNDYTYLNTVVARGSGDTLSTSDWFFSKNPREIGLASIPVGNGTEKIFMLRTGDFRALENYSTEVNKFMYKGYISAFLGEIFKPSAEDAFCVVSDWIIIGSKEAINAYHATYYSDDFFSFSKYIAQTPADFSIEDNVSVLFVMNLSGSKRTFEAIFKRPLSDNLIAGFSSNNFNFFSYKLINDGSGLNVESSILMENLEELPALNRKAVKRKKAKTIDDTPLTLSKGPFKIRNVATGKSNYIQQLLNNDLRLLDHNEKSVWVVSFSQPLCGYVEQIDYLKNRKLQAMFAAGSKVYLIDRLGRWVSPFPLDLKKGIALGPEVHDFRGVRSYSMMVLHTDNTVELYDINGRRVQGWNVITEDEKIKSMPEILYVGGKRYWVVRTFFQTKIYNRVGIVVADFSRKRRLKTDTRIRKLSSNEIIVTTIDNTNMILNLETGAFRKSE